MIRMGIVGLLFFFAACSHNQPQSAQQRVFQDTLTIDSSAFLNYGNNATSFTIGPFDRLDIRIWQYPDLSGEVLVKDDGTVFLPNAGNVRVAGMSLTEAQSALTSALRPYVPNPQLDLRPTEVHANVFYIVGEFQRPGAYPIMRPTRLHEAVALAGGFSESALIDSAYLSRGGRAFPVNLQASFSSRNQAVYMQAGDVIYVPSQTSARVYVLGEVRSPTSVPISNAGLGVLQAIAAAGGFTNGAKEGEVAVIRRVDDQIQLQVVDVRTVMQRGSGEALLFRLQPGDVVWVPPSGLANWNRALEGITPTLDTFVFRPLGGLRDFFIIRGFIFDGIQ
jgi:polysaccharide biosynthesis/export protein